MKAAVKARQGSAVSARMVARGKAGSSNHAFEGPIHGDASVDVRYRTDRRCRTGARFDGGLMNTTLQSDHREGRATDGNHQSDAFVLCTGPLGRAGSNTGFGTNPRRQLEDAGNSECRTRLRRWRVPGVN